MVKPNPGDKPSLLTHSDFFFLILLTISHYAQLFTLFTLRGNEVDTAQCRPHSASQYLAIPEEAGYQPAEQALLLFSRVFSNERSTKRAWSARHAPRVKACVTPLCLALLAPRTRKSVTIYVQPICQSLNTTTWQYSINENKVGSLRASSPIWASEASLARTRERAAKPRGAEAPRSRVLARLALPAQTGELARRLHSGILTDAFPSLAFFKSSFANAFIAAFCVITLGIRQASVSMLAFINVCV